MISGTATLITVASARVRKTPGASARTTSQGFRARGPEECVPERVMWRVYPVTRAEEPACCWGSIGTCRYVTSSPRWTAWPRSRWPSRGTTWVCRSGRRPTSCRAGRTGAPTWRPSSSSRSRWTTACSTRPRAWARGSSSAITRSSSTRSSASRTTPSRGGWRCARRARAWPSSPRTPASTRRAAAWPTSSPSMLGLEAVQPLQPAAADVLKLVGFVPEDDADLVRKALFASGAGVIGEYEHCSLVGRRAGHVLRPRGQHARRPAWPAATRRSNELRHRGRVPAAAAPPRRRRVHRRASV